MASRKNDKLLARTVEGSINLYSNQRVECTAADRGLAERLGSCNYNIVSNSDKHEVYLRELRPTDHYVDHKGRQTIHFFGARRRKFAGDERSMVAESMKQPEDHPRQNARAQQRLETQLAQLENSRSYSGFQERCAKFHGSPPPKKFQVHNARYANEVEKLRPQIISKDEWQGRRGETMTHAKSAPSLSITDPAASLSRAMREDIRKETSQRQLESAHVAPRMNAQWLANSMDAVPLGRSISAAQQYCSVSRIENHDFGVSKKNNHYSAQDPLTRADPYYMPPRVGMTNNSVKYDIISNERRWFKY